MNSHYPIGSPDRSVSESSAEDRLAHVGGKRTAHLWLRIPLFSVENTRFSSFENLSSFQPIQSILK